MTFTIRPATKNDIETLEAFQRQSADYVRPFDPTLKKEGRIEYYNIQELIQSKNVNLLVVEKDRKIVACGYGEIKDSPGFMEEKRLGYIGFMYVLDDFRRNGLGKLILDELFKWFKENKIRDVTLKVYSENVHAIKFYGKYGFKPVVTTMHIQIK